VVEGGEEKEHCETAKLQERTQACSYPRRSTEDGRLKIDGDHEELRLSAERRIRQATLERGCGRVKWQRV
jgi:hypothetical protein